MAVTVKTINALTVSNKGGIAFMLGRGVSGVYTARHHNTTPLISAVQSQLDARYNTQFTDGVITWARSGIYPTP